MTGSFLSKCRFVILICFSFILAACSATRVDYPDDIKESMPLRTPVKNITGFTEGLQCMDSMFQRYKVRPIRITAAQIPDFSESRGDAGYGAREMLISAISTMSQKSGAIRFIAYDRSTPDIIALQSAHPRKNEFVVPDFFLRGAVTQIDSSPYSKQRGFSLSGNELWEEQSIHGAQLSNSSSASLKSVSADLNLGLINNFELLPGISSSNAFAVEKRGSSDDISLNIWKLGAIYSLNENKTDALSSGLRALMEVGAIEIFGKLYNLPYWDCLGVLGTDSEMEADARKLYRKMSVEKRIEWIGNELIANKYMKETDKLPKETDGEKSLTDAFRQAISHFKATNGLFGNSYINFELFSKLYQKKQFSKLTSTATSEVKSSPMEKLVTDKKVKKTDRLK